MNIDRILSELNSAKVAYLLIGGVNFLLRHQGPLTHDVDVWVRDSDDFDFEASFKKARVSFMSSKQFEEAKRDRQYDPVERWKHTQEAIQFAEANLAPEKRRNTPAAAKKNEAKLLEYFKRNER